MSRQENMEMGKNTGAGSKIEPLRRRMPGEREADVSGMQESGEKEKEVAGGLKSSSGAEAAIHEKPVPHPSGQAVTEAAAQKIKKERQSVFLLLYVSFHH